MLRATQTHTLFGNNLTNNTSFFSENNATTSSVLCMGLIKFTGNQQNGNASSEMDDHLSPGEECAQMMDVAITGLALAFIMVCCLLRVCCDAIAENARTARVTPYRT